MFALHCLLVLIGLSLPSHAVAANNFSAKRAASSQPIPIKPSQEIRVGERLEYTVSWMGVPVGYGVVEVKEKTKRDGRETYLVTAEAGTNEVLSALYPVKDELRSWIDAETLQSLRFEKNVSEGFYRAKERVRYDWKQKKGFYESLNSGEKKEFGISLPVQDVISAFFWVRRQEMTPGQNIKGTVNNGEKDYELLVDVLNLSRREMRGFGELELWTVEPKTKLEGVLDKRGRVWVELMNNLERTPVLITLKTPFGPINGVLKKSSYHKSDSR